MLSCFFALLVHSALFGFSGFGFDSEEPEKTYTIHLAPVGPDSQKYSGEKNRQKEKHKGRDEEKGRDQSNAKAKDRENQEGTEKDDTAPGKVSEENRAKYNHILAAWLQKNQYYPMIARKQGMQGYAVVQIQIRRNGTLASYKIVKKTGYGILDKAIDTIMQRSNPFPAVPDTITGDPVTATVPIQFQLR